MWHWPSIKCKKIRRLGHRGVWQNKNETMLNHKPQKMEMANKQNSTTTTTHSYLYVYRVTAGTAQIIGKKKKRINCWKRLAWVSTIQRERVAEGRTRRNLLAKKIQGTNRSGEGGRRACYVTQDLSYDCSRRGREKKKGEHSKWDGKTNRKITIGTHVNPSGFNSTKQASTTK